MEYDHTQRGHFLWPVLAICGLILVPLALSDEVSPGWVAFGVAVVAIVAVAGVVFGKLRVTVGNGRVVDAPDELVESTKAQLRHVAPSFLGDHEQIVGYVIRFAGKLLA